MRTQQRWGACLCGVGSLLALLVLLAGVSQVQAVQGVEEEPVAIPAPGDILVNGWKCGPAVQANNCTTCIIRILETTIQGQTAKRCYATKCDSQLLGILFRICVKGTEAEKCRMREDNEQTILCNNNCRRWLCDDVTPVPGDKFECDGTDCNCGDEGGESNGGDYQKINKCVKS